MSVQQLFNFENNNIDIIIIENEPWFWAADVARACGLENNYKDHIKNYLDDDEKHGGEKHTHGRSYSGTRISESGLYELLNHGRNDLCKLFRRWVRKEVLPSIRKTGSYSTKDYISREQLELEYKPIKPKPYELFKGNLDMFVDRLAIPADVLYFIEISADTEKCKVGLQTTDNWSTLKTYGQKKGRGDEYSDILFVCPIPKHNIHKAEKELIKEDW
eukprot:Pgem_evm4s8792